MAPPPTQTLTNRTYTGHQANNLGSGSTNLGLIYMNARYYVAGIGRFASADTIVPNPQNPQSFNRYSYVRNNPLNLVDPTGHRECGEDCNDMLPHEIIPPESSVPDFIPENPPFGILPANPADFNGDISAQGFGDTTFAYHRRRGTTDIDPNTNEVYPEMYNALGNLHSGWDIPMDSDTTLVALGDGEVMCIGVDCGQSATSGGTGIAIQYNSCSCVVFYLHTSKQSVTVGSSVTAGMVVGESGVGNGYAHLHLEIRPSVTSLTFYNPIYFFTPEALAAADLTFMDYESSSNEQRIYGYRSYDRITGYGYYWEGSLPEIWEQ